MRSDTFLSELGVDSPQRNRWMACACIGLGLFFATAAPALASVACSSDADCDDSNPCTNDRCVGVFSRICFHESTCDNDKFCDGSALCCINPLGCAGGVSFGTCIPGTPVSCDPGEFCVEVGNGECVECNEDPSVGSLVGCDDGSECTADSCVDDLCVNAPLIMSCDDGDACTTDDACTSGECSGVPVDCSPRMCFGGANDGLGCENILGCPDNNGSCQGDVCIGGLDNGTACTVDGECRGDDGDCLAFCVDGANDAQPCNTSAECPDGFCTSCRAGSCSSTTGLCSYPALNGTTCNDGSRCTAEDLCEFGECVGGPSITACIDLELRRAPGQQRVSVGEIVDFEVWATLNSCDLSLITECDGVRMPIFSVELAFTWDPSVFELVGAADPCDGQTCANINCGTFPVTQYDWLTGGFLNDCALDRLNADCGPDLCCDPFVNDSVFNDGDAVATFLSQVPFCETACVSGSGLHVSTLQFRALRATEGVEPPTEVQLETCIGNTPTRVIRFGGGAHPNATRDLGPAVDVIVECVTSADCPPGDAACVDGTCVSCLTPTVSAAGPRYLSVEPDPFGTDPVALLVTGVGADLACVSKYVAASGLIGTGAIFQTPAEWGRISVRGPEILGSRTYNVQADCDPANPGTALSVPVAVTLWVNGDADNNGVVDILDITREIDGFRGLRLDNTTCVDDTECTEVLPNFECDLAAARCHRIKLENVDIIGAGSCSGPDNDISILDVSKVIDLFRALPDRCLGPCE